MGAEDEQQGKQANEQPRPNSITEAQFLSWKRRKVFPFFFFGSLSPLLGFYVLVHVHRFIFVLVLRIVNKIKLPEIMWLR
uniref:Uncharacterized protein n=1 Tax=Rhizophora mucronata TaxID=61149 RepID=A0A2P2KST5_RHIMU